MNELQARIKDVTRKMMAMVSEVSMNQANALKLQQTLKEKEGELEQCYIRYSRICRKVNLNENWNALFQILLALQCHEKSPMLLCILCQ